MATQESILAELTRRFADLGRELGFSEPFVRDVAGWETHLVMVRNGHGLRMRILWYDLCVIVDVVRLRGGRIPTEYVERENPDGTWGWMPVLEVYNAIPTKTKAKRFPAVKTWDDMEPYYYRSLKELDLIRENPEVLLKFMDSIDDPPPPKPKKIGRFLAKD